MTAPDLDALVARINALADCSYWANAGWDIPGDATQVIGRLAVQAAAALVQLREENARLTATVKEWACDQCNTVYPGPPQAGFSCVMCPKCSGHTMPLESLKLRRAEAEVDRRRKGGT